jgi:hypothetical protein
MSEKVTNPPRVRARMRGHMSEMLESTAEAFLKANPSLDVRYVYDPASKPENSKRMSRLAEGYRIVNGKELGNANLGDANAPVRIGDLTLMAIPKEKKEELQRERDEIVREEMNRLTPAFHDSVKAISEVGPSGTHEGRPIGNVTIKVEEKVYELEQRKGDK